jgi:glycosyltransferase involved in cell wall biosynthesis
MEEQMVNGESLFNSGKIEESKNYFLTLLEKFPDNAEILNNIGVIFHEQGNIDEAEHYFLRAQVSQADYVDAILNLADLYQNQKRWKEVGAHLEKYTSIIDNNYSVFNQLGLVYMEMGDIVSARTVLEKSLGVNPDQEEIKDILDILREKQDKNLAKRDLPVTTISHQRQPTVSVGLPVYNGGKLVGQAIESILSQDYQDIELIISDNCSTDNTEEICLKYQKMDKRVKYYRFEANLGGKNFADVLARSNSPYFMWAAHDDLHELAFISKCLKKIVSDPSIALVYPRTKVLDANSRFLGIANDHLNTDQDDPIERFSHLIWEIGMCNMFYGLYRTSMLRRAHVWGDTLFADNLVLAEIALLGKIVQIDDALFIRRLTRNYNYKTPDERYEQLISGGDPKQLMDGITLPHCRFTYANLELVKYLEIEDSEKSLLINDVLKCFKTRFGAKMQYDIDRAVRLINDEVFYCTWDNKRLHIGNSDNFRTINYFHISALLKNLQEALFIFPERTDLKDAYGTCLEKLSDFQAVLP